MRFPHEAEAVRERGGFIIRVNRDYEVDLSHESERAVNEINPDFVINNLGTLIDLEWQVCDMMNKVGLK